MNQTGPGGMWDEEDGFYYDVLRLPDGCTSRLKVRSMVGLLPFAATTILSNGSANECPSVRRSGTAWEECPSSSKRPCHRGGASRVSRAWHNCAGE